MTRSIKSRTWSDASPKRDEAGYSDLYRRHRFGMRLGLDRIRAVLTALGNPHENFRSIHIAGTNGKGSTAAMLEAILREAGLSTGLYTSPHLISLEERFRINGSPVDDKKLKRALEVVMTAEASLQLESPLTFFEVTTAAALLLFAEFKVDWAVLETGLGGRLDATNVVQPKVSVITSIGLDHCDYLGTTLAEVAVEKAGIIKEGTPVICGAGPCNTGEACDVIHRIAQERNAAVTCCRVPTDLPVNLRGRHQKMNAALAVAAIRQLRRDSSDVHGTDDQIRAGLAKVEWPGRLQLISRDPYIMVDGAHNPHAMASLVRYIKEEEPRPWTIILGMMADKDCDEAMALLRPVARRLIFVKLKSERSWNPPGAIDLHTALRSARDDLPPGGGILITGSLYLAGQALGAADHAQGPGHSGIRDRNARKLANGL